VETLCAADRIYEFHIITIREMTRKTNAGKNTLILHTDAKDF
jgi:hypothetical protein